MMAGGQLGAPWTRTINASVKGGSALSRLLAACSSSSVAVYRRSRFTLRPSRETHHPLTSETIQVLYRTHAYAVFRRCRQLLSHDQEADDAVQEVFLRLLEDPGRFQGRSSPATFLYAVATHVCLNRLRSASARDAAWQASVARNLQEATSGPAATAEARQLARSILAETDQETAAIAVYHFIDGLPQGEIAAIVGRSRVTVNQRLQQFRRDALRRSESP